MRIGSDFRRADGPEAKAEAGNEPGTEAGCICVFVRLGPPKGARKAAESRNTPGPMPETAGRGSGTNRAADGSLRAEPRQHERHTLPVRKSAPPPVRSAARQRPHPLRPAGGALRASPGLSASRSMRIFRPAMEAARPPLSVRSALPGFSRMCELELSNKSDFNDFTPAGMNSDRGDFRFSGLVRQPLYVSCGAVSEQANIRKGRAYRMIRAKAAGCARANFALRANGTHRDGEGASGELYGRSCGARGRLTSGAVRRGRFVAGAGMPPPPHGAATCRGVPKIRRTGERGPRGASADAAIPHHCRGVPKIRRTGERGPRTASADAAIPHGRSERRCPRMNFPTSGEGGREDDASRQSRPDKLRAGGSLPEPECPPPHGAATCRGVPKVRQARERGPRGGSIPRRNASADAAIPHGRSERRRPG